MSKGKTEAIRQVTSWDHMVCTNYESQTEICSSNFG